ncbi:PAQR family membrane homeostasis protein TrhA [Sulfitobacter sp. S190]|uniref:PAQR family membrane homeostasis protein TrhA n=1 Tax=Sulfitobacter sp. S190 TaxID=2867022 RepID=UPI0021A31931|nr:hemolysin III family protein [Sulfitobacter sp. S190]UWR21651.1 hemolysin III family protein [Sulfitobacter sp. S190]
MAYPHSKPETIADGAVHVAGLLFSLPATAILMMMANGWLTTMAVAVYGICMIAAFGASALYHLSPVDRTRPLLNRIDHAAIYFKIAGTYTPLVVVIGSGFAYGILGVVWALALIGAVAKLRGWSTHARGSLALYLLMGWLSVLLVKPMWQTLSGTAIELIVAGGLIYSFGTVIYARERLRFQNAIWHGFVLVASVCFFAAIAISLG